MELETEAISIYKLGDKKLYILPEPNSESPREWDNLSMFIFTKYANEIKNKGFQFSSNYDSQRDFIKKGEKEIRHFLKEDVAVCLPVQKYEHGNIAFSTSFDYPFNDRWDAGTIGFVVVTKKAIRKTFDIKRVTQKYIDKAEEIAEAELETFSEWANGEVYGFQVVDSQGEELDSCWGFYGLDIKENGMLEHLGEEWENAEEVK